MWLVPALAGLAFAAAYFLFYPYLLPRRASLAAAAFAALAAAGAGRRLPPPFGIPRAAESRKPEPVSRFAGPLPFEPDPVQPGTLRGLEWTRGQAGGRPAWLDRGSGLLWGAALEPQFTEYSESSWREAARACREQSPAGFWALPTMAEFIKARKNGLPRAVDDFARLPRWFATVFVPDAHFQLTGLFLAVPSDNDPSGARFIGARCVGRTPAAPEQGYLATTNEEAIEALTGGKR